MNPLHTAAPADTETHVLVANVQASLKDVLVQLSIHLPLTMQCIIALTAGGAYTNGAVTVTVYPFTVINMTILVLGWFTAWHLYELTHTQT